MDDFQGSLGRRVAGRILKTGNVCVPAGAMGRLLGDRGCRDQVSRQSRYRIESEFTSNRRLSRLLDAIGPVAAEKS